MNPIQAKADAPLDPAAHAEHPHSDAHRHAHHDAHDHDHDHGHGHAHDPANPAPDHPPGCGASNSSANSSTPRPATGCGCSGPAGDEHDAHAGHDHGVLPSWPRIAAALVVALGAEVCHWLAKASPSAAQSASHHLAWLSYLGMALAVAGVALAGLGVYKSGIQSLLRGHLGIHALMAVAVTGAFLIGQWPEAAMVMALYAAAERIEDQAMDRARNAIRSLLNLAPETADVLQPDGSIQKTAVADVPMGATVRIAPGALVPLDRRSAQHRQGHGVGGHQCRRRQFRQATLGEIF